MSAECVVLGLEWLSSDQQEALKSVLLQEQVLLQVLLRPVLCCKSKAGTVHGLRSAPLPVHRSALCAELWGERRASPAQRRASVTCEIARPRRPAGGRPRRGRLRRASAAVLVMDSRLKPEPSGGRP